MLAEEITPLFITFNEAPNLGRALAKVQWAKRIIVLDSGSTDETRQIASGYPQVEVLQRPFDSFAAQCNFGLSQVRTEWVLSLDADYILSDAFIAEILGMNALTACGFEAPFAYCIDGHPLRGTLYPPRCVLYRTESGQYRDYGHGHKVTINGPLRRLKGVIYHDDRKPLARWLRSQLLYARQEAEYLKCQPANALSGNDRLRKIGWIAPLAVVPYTLFVKGCILDGLPGWRYALQRLFAETLIALELTANPGLRVAPKQPENGNGILQNHHEHRH